MRKKINSSKVIFPILLFLVSYFFNFSFAPEISVFQNDTVVNDKEVKLEENTQMVIGIEDNGIGMSAQKLTGVMSGNNTHSKAGTLNETGTGFGIRLCKEFITINKVKLWAESVENKQTIFYFSLPKVN